MEERLFHEYGMNRVGASALTNSNPATVAKFSARCCN
jgi:hypothetical protein